MRLELPRSISIIMLLKRRSVCVKVPVQSNKWWGNAMTDIKAQIKEFRIGEKIRGLVIRSG
jgi:hypothetical protein